AATEQLPPEQRERPWSAGVPDTPSVPEAPASHGFPSPRPLDVPRSVSASSLRGGSPRRRLLAMLATVAVALAGVGGVPFELVPRAQQQERAALMAPSPEVNRLLADLDRAGARHAVLHSPDGQVAAAVAEFPDTHKVMPLRLAANPVRDTVYVLWGLGEGP